jgi:hypothetical protein
MRCCRKVKIYTLTLLFPLLDQIPRRQRTLIQNYCQVNYQFKLRTLAEVQRHPR